MQCKYLCTNIFVFVQKKLYNDPMGMKLLDKIRRSREITDYGIAKELNRLGVEITTQGINSYNKPTAKSMRLDVLCGLRKLSGNSWNEFGKWLEDEFFK